jgi:muramoyltetrapeptide carboxypeptidase
LVDYEAIRTDPKIIVGLSNPAILLNAITSKTGVPTFHGPNGVDFGYEELIPFTTDKFWPIVSENLALPYSYSVDDEINVVRSAGTVEGRLFGGHLKTVQRLIGTHWAPEWKDSILFLEEYTLNFSEVDKALTHFKLAGILDSIAGLIFGRPVECDPVQVETIEDILLRICAESNYPIFNDIRIGHTEEKITVPIGCRVRLNSEKPSFQLLESPTC